MPDTCVARQLASFFPASFGPKSLPPRQAKNGDWAIAAEAADISGLLALDQWLEQMPPAQWKATPEAIAGSDETVECLRVHTRTGRPLGGDSFLSRLENVINRRIRANAVGRPKGSRDKSKRTRRVRPGTRR